jgi:tetratricopeptide (TPR) repeat protein
MKKSSLKKKPTVTQKRLLSKSEYLTEYLSASWHPYALIILLGVLVFGRTIWFNYTYFDDDLIILKKIDSLSNLSTIFQSFKTLYFSAYYRPFITISLIIDAQISNISPWMYHVSNLVYHLIAGCLTYYLLLKLNSSRLMALIAGIVFILHPLATQAVAWILGRNDSLVAIFILISFIFLINSVSYGKIYYYLLHVLFFFIALLTKETAVVSPVIALVYLTLIARYSLFSMKTIKYFLGWVFVLILWFLLRSAALNGLKLNEGIFSYKGIVSNFPALIELLGKLVFPVRLSVYPTINSISVILGTLAISALMISLFLWKKNINRLVVFSIIWIVLFNLPGMVVTIADNLNRFSYLESRAYISIIGFVILLAGMEEWITALSPQRLISIIISVTVIYSIIIFKYSSYYQTPLNHWNKAVEMSPGAADAWFNLALVSADIYNNIDMAEVNLKKAIALNYDNPSYHNWLGTIYGQKNLPSQAEYEFNISLKLDPDDPNTYFNLGYLNYLNKQFPAAEKYYMMSVKVDSSYSASYYQLITLYIQQMKYDDALKYAGALKARGFNLDPALLEQIHSRR